MLSMCAAQLNLSCTTHHACQRSYTFATPQRSSNPRSKAYILFSESWPFEVLTSGSIGTLMPPNNLSSFPLFSQTLQWFIQILITLLHVPSCSQGFPPCSLQTASFLICPRKQELSVLKTLTSCPFYPRNLGPQALPTLGIWYLKCYSHHPFHSEIFTVPSR